MRDPDFTRRFNEFIHARGADYEQLIADRRERRRQQKRDARKLQTTEQRNRERLRKQDERKRSTPEQHAHEQQREQRRERKARPFMAIDGEGGGTDALGRQNYLLMVASCPVTGVEHVRHRDGVPLSTRDCFEFILSLPANCILVGYGFGYDVTQAIRGLHEQALRRILKAPQGKHGPLSTYWGDYAITYQVGQYVRIARVDRGDPKRPVVRGSSRTVYETLGFFQCPFIKAITDWDIGTEEERAVIAENKARRDEFSELTEEIKGYCKLECSHLATLMTEFREVCTSVGIIPRQWSGAGWLAAALLEKHGVPKRPLTAREIAALGERKPTKNSRPPPTRRPERDPAFELAANHAYYGGRFEVSRIGLIAFAVYEYDLKSAYPAAMLHLPCPLHTRWEHRPRAKQLPKRGLYLAKVTFSHPDGRWCGFPFRHNGGLFWPFQGTGWYWSPEIEAVIKHLKAEIVVHDVWVARCECNCRPFDWVRDLYEERRRLGPDARGKVLKLVLNSLYGKLAQRSGRGPFHDAVAAGLITAITRARLIEAIGQDPAAIVMVATDAVFSTRPLKLDIGEGLGQWEEKIWPDLFIAQPGVYWSPTKLQESVKSRGAPRSVIGPAAPRFHQAFNGWLDTMRSPGAMSLVLKERLIPSVPVTVHVFYGHRLALAWGKPWLAGKWKDVSRNESFEWSTKRDAMRIELGDDHVITYPIALSSPLVESEGYKPADFDRLVEIAAEDGGTEIVDENTLLEAMPDHVEFLPHE